MWIYFSLTAQCDRHKGSNAAAAACWDESLIWSMTFQILVTSQRSEESMPIEFNMVNKYYFLAIPFVLCLFSGFRSSLEQLHSNRVGSCGSWASLFNPHALFSQDCLSFLFNSLAFGTTTIALSANVPQNHLEKQFELHELQVQINGCF